MMNNRFVAHSSPKDKPDKSPHLYSDHIREVEQHGMEYAERMLAYSAISQETKNRLKISLQQALRVHDIGKLEPGNQEVLWGRKNGKLPYDHVDGGVAVALSKGDKFAAWLVRAHHAPGLASVSDERSLLRRIRPSTILRGKRHHRASLERDDIIQHKELIKKTDAIVSNLVSDHETCCNHHLVSNQTDIPDDALTSRLLLSCLVDADHSDTASYYAESHQQHSWRTRWGERLKKLEEYVSALEGGDSERKLLRDQLFDQCLSNNTNERIVSCAAPVGLGKTTAVMANLLKHARDNELRRIFIIAPFTNIITQTANKLREVLVLEDENPDEIIGEHHHRVEFSNAELRQYTQTWKAPIVVTTAVQFFETLANASPSGLRKLHEMPGSAIFVDESHACLPPHLMRQAWYWTKQLSSDWSCHFVLASGSLIRFWENDEIVGAAQGTNIPSLLDKDFFKMAQSAEHKRVKLSCLRNGNAMTKSDLLKKVQLPNGQRSRTTSKLIILNTVQSAAVVAKGLQPLEEAEAHLSDRSVLHLSTALTPADRERIIGELNTRQPQNSPWQSRDWYLIATSCVEAGVDLDFDYGYRERCSITSFLQTAGRVNRENLNPDSILYDFSLQEADGVIKHPGFKDSIKIFERYRDDIFKQDCNLDELSTRALIAELREGEINWQFIDKLFTDETECNFQQVQKKFKVIDSQTVTAIVDSTIKEKIDRGYPVSYRDIQRNSVQIWHNKIERYHLEPCGQGTDNYYWNYSYEPDFLGYMKDLNLMLQHGGWIV